MFAGCQLPLNQPFAAVLLPAALPLGEGRTDSKRICLLCRGVAEVLRSLGTANVNSIVWCRRGWTRIAILFESQIRVNIFPWICEAPRERRG